MSEGEQLASMVDAHLVILKVYRIDEPDDCIAYVNSFESEEGSCQIIRSMVGEDIEDMIFFVDFDSILPYDSDIYQRMKNREEVKEDVFPMLDKMGNHYRIKGNRFIRIPKNQLKILL